MSVEKCKLVTEKYTTMKKLIAAFEECGDLLLCQFKGIGKVLSKRVHQYVCQ
jgi:hypothetical protein